MFIKYVALVIFLTARLTAAWPNTTGATPILRPTQGEILTPGATYTISWNPPEATSVDIYIWDDFPVGGSAIDFGPLCKGWIIQPHCGEVANDIPNSGEYAWVIPVPESYRAGDQDDPKFVIWLNVWAEVTGPDSMGRYFMYSGNFSFMDVYASSSLPLPTPTSLPLPSQTSTLPGLPSLSRTVSTGADSEEGTTTSSHSSAITLPSSTTAPLSLRITESTSSPGTSIPPTSSIPSSRTADTATNLPQSTNGSGKVVSGKLGAACYMVLIGVCFVA